MNVTTHGRLVLWESTRVASATNHLYSVTNLKKAAANVLKGYQRYTAGHPSVYVLVLLIVDRIEMFSSMLAP
jgi:hypothetical protein